MDSKAPKKLDKKNSKTNLSLQKRQKEDNVKRKLKKLISSKNAEISLNDSSEFQFTSKHAIQSRQISDMAKACRNKETEADNPKSKSEVKKASEPVQEQQLRRCSEPVKEVNHRSSLHTENAKIEEIKEQGKSIKCLRSEDDKGRQSDETYSLCTVCNQKISVSQIKSHQLQCLKDRFQAKKSAGQERERTLEDKEENEFVENSSEDAVLCQFCNKDLTMLNSILKNQHVSYCMDKIELQKQKVNKGKPTENSAFGVFNCPICGKVLKTERARKIHFKRCSQNYGITPEDSLKMTNVQTEGHVKNTSKKKPSKFDEDLQMALAMSKSMKETDSNDQPTLQAPATKRGKQASRKGKKQLEGKGSEPVLLLLQDDEKQKRLSLKVAAMLLPQEFGSDDNSDDITPCDDCTVKIKCTGSDGIDTGIDTQVKSFWTRSTLNEDQISCSQKKGLFYVESLMPPITVSQVDLGSKADKKREMSCDQRGSPSKERTSYQMAYLSSGDDYLSASTQTAVNLALLETEDQDQPECTITDINCSGFCPEKMIDIPEEVTKSVSLTLKENLSSLVDNSDHSDIQIVCENKTINAHKIILAIRCPSFLQRITEDPVALKDETYEVILSVLKFIYAGEISLTRSSLVDVRNVAERMGITELAEICEVLEKDGCTGTTGNGSYQNDIEIESLPSSDIAGTAGKGSYQNNIEIDLSPSSDSARTTRKKWYQNDIDIDLLPSSDSETDVIHMEEHGVESSHRVDSGLHNLSKTDSETEHLHLSDSKNNSVHKYDGKSHMCDSEIDVVHVSYDETDILQKDDRKINISAVSDGKEYEVNGYDIQSSYGHASDIEVDNSKRFNLKCKNEESFGNEEHSEESCMDTEDDVKNRSRDRHKRGEEKMDCDEDDIDASASDSKLVIDEHIAQASSEEKHSECEQKYTEMCDLSFGDDSFWTQSDLSVEDAMNRTFEDIQNRNLDREESPYRTEMRPIKNQDIVREESPYRTEMSSIKNRDINTEGSPYRTEMRPIKNRDIDREESPYRTEMSSIKNKDISREGSPYRTEMRSIRFDEEKLEICKQEIKVGSEHLYTDCDGYQERNDIDHSPGRSENELRAVEVSSQHQVIGTHNTSDSDYAGDGINLTDSFNASSPPLKMDGQELDLPVLSMMSFEKKRQKPKTDTQDKQEFCKTPKSNAYAKQGDSRRNFTIPSPFTPMPTYDKMNTPALKREVQRFGVKPVGKKRMVMLLKDIYHKTHEYETESEFEVSKNDLEDIPSVGDLDDFPTDNDLDIPNNDLDEIPMMDEFDDDIPACDDLDFVICDSDVEDDACTASQESDRSDLIEESYFEMGNLTPTSSPTKSSGADLSQKFRQFISDHEDIHKKLLLCEPLELDLLKKQMTETGIKCSMEKLMDVLDEMCITFTMKNSRKREKRKKKTTSK